MTNDVGPEIPLVQQIKSAKTDTRNDRSNGSGKALISVIESVKETTSQQRNYPTRATVAQQFNDAKN
jgi:hypothetical protein